MSEQEYYEEELERYNRLASTAHALGITVKTGELQPPELTADGTEARSNDPTDNAFCPTGPGGGVDPSCSPGNSGESSAEEEFNFSAVPPKIQARRDREAKAAKRAERMERAAKELETREPNEEDAYDFIDAAIDAGYAAASPVGWASSKVFKWIFDKMLGNK